MTEKTVVKRALIEVLFVFYTITVYREVLENGAERTWTECEPDYSGNAGIKLQASDGWTSFAHATLRALMQDHYAAGVDITAPPYIIGLERTMLAIQHAARNKGQQL